MKLVKFLKIDIEVKYNIKKNESFIDQHLKHFINFFLI